MIGQSLSAISRTVTRSGVRFAGIIGVAVAASTAQGQVNPAPVTTDTTNQLVVSADTTKEVTHVVKKGDTLWDLAKFYLKDPFRWPEIFRRNTDVVENPHWIYPGEVIRIWGHEVRADALAKADSAGEVVSHIVTRPVVPQESQNTGGRSDLTVFASPMSRASAAMASDASAGGGVIGRSHGGGVRRGEVEAAPYIDRSGGPRGSGRIAATVDRPGIKTNASESRFQLNDDLYIDLPRGVVPRLGDTYLSYVLGSEVSDIGQVVIPTGILRIESVSGRTLARIVKQFGPIELDQGLTAMPDLTFPTGPLSPVTSTMNSGKVIYVHDDPVLPSIGHYVVISAGAKNGVHVGDQYTFVDQSVGREDDRAAPPIVAGAGQVVRVTPSASTVIITGQIQPTIREGMPVRLSGRMP